VDATGGALYQCGPGNMWVFTTSLVGPTGPAGPPGPPGMDATVTVGTTVTLPPGSPATVTNSGSPGAAVLDFGIPGGASGPGTIIPYSNGDTPVTLSTLSGDPVMGAVLGFGSQSLSPAVVFLPELSLGTLPYIAFPLPVDALLTGISGFFAPTIAFAVPIGIVSITFQLYVSTAITGPSDSFVPIPGALLTLPALLSFQPATYIVTATSPALSIPLTAGTRVLMFIYATSNIGAITEVTGTAGASIVLS